MKPSDLSLVATKILTSFIHHPTLTYSQAQPGDVDNDLYKYHLKFLLTKGLIEKSTNQYNLTTSGQQLVHQLSSQGQLQDTFQVSVMCYVTLGDQVLMHKRTRQPFLGDLEFVTGKMQLGEAPENAAARKLLEESGLTATFTFLGIIRKIRYIETNKLFQDTIYHVCKTSYPTGKLITKNDWGENFWLPKDQVGESQKNNLTRSPVTDQLIQGLIADCLNNFYLVDTLHLPHW